MLRSLLGQAQPRQGEFIAITTIKKSKLDLTNAPPQKGNYNCEIKSMTWRVKYIVLREGCPLAEATIEIDGYTIAAHCTN